ncbi:PilN domain-containing protein [Massilia sp. H6]|uniref:PilN domain-containing protein n=1 Tax=Massilia sp. H6 TaxID=2970464 RepID=UPI0021673DF9|nr:PilN domain-containing protein [Massilia sp. H6]UVW29954.1 PilN domain-containing protein [Massilia sp. H6]
MKRLHIDFAPRSLHRTLFRTPGRIAFLAVAFGCLLLVAATHWSAYREQREQLDALHAALAARSLAARPHQVSERSKPALPEAQVQAVNNAIMQLNLPWRDLVEAVRAATPPDVALLALEPDARQRSLRITAETRTSDDMLAYVARMQEQGWFASVVLTRHEIAEEDPNRPLRFQLSAQWGGQ